MPLPTNPATENVLGTIGTICWTVQLIPQLWKSWREKSTDGLSHWLVLVWGVAGAFLGVYVIVQSLSIPLIVQPQAFGILSLISWGQCLYYGQRRPFTIAISAFLAVTAVTAGFEAGMVYAIRPAYNAGNHTPVEFFGIFSSVIIALALAPQYYEIYRRREVVGISLIFMVVDCSGGVFSTLSLVFAKKFDVIAAVTYLLVVVLDGTVLLLAAILNPRARRKRAREAAANAVAAETISSTITIAPVENSDEEKAAYREERDGILP
ncbi:uncharacterized protein PHACADRAFT_263811 [Phanerochaete carnosa HHB-10118-sp]|uniref:PQ-loop-domain-containing protein n=1 Tax=Phanerochaete carnosa (strain HHB-10118-sp) TaxID=650164 RepID=K5WJR2_PHACS|nr:uncharacterized protein PHACADRAFT_263811 [Phanerochaete carnosa HHB-10118-sp]EKM50492.1 hypothetical protein PHACADRAFT_263811 [Phanerochaete carnosa HHB-10118-sp]